jgi:hemolysin activation/secretion protein
MPVSSRSWPLAALAVLVLFDGRGVLAQQAPAPIASIILLATPAQLVPADEPATGVDVSRIEAPQGAQLAARLGELLGLPIERGSLDRLRMAVTEHYRDAGRPFLDVGLPRQDVTHGVVQLVVTEYRVGSVRVEGNSWFSNAFILGRADLAPGSHIDKASLDRRVARLNNGPYLSVTPEFSAGTAAGTTDVVLRAADRMPLQLTTGFANTGSAVTGWERWSLGASWADGFRAGHILDWRMSSSSDFARARLGGQEEGPPRFVSHQLGWRIPLPSGDSIQLTGSHARGHPRLGGELASRGLNVELGAFYQMPLSSASGAPSQGPRQELGFGYEFKRSNNDLSFGGSVVQSGFTEVSQFVLRYTLVSGGADGLTTLQNAAVLSPGGMTPANSDGDFQPAGVTRSGLPGAHARYAYNRVNLMHQLPLSERSQLVLRGAAQVATGTMLASEQLAIAGIDAVRGYREFARAGSNGIVLGAELRGPPLGLLSRLADRMPEDTLRPHLFIDAGHGWSPSASGAAPARQRTASFGVGAQYDVGQGMSLRLEQGWQLAPDRSEGANGAFLHVALTAAW